MDDPLAHLPLLPFHRSALAEIHHPQNKDGLVVVARGLGSQILLAASAALAAHETALVLIVAANADQHARSIQSILSNSYQKKPDSDKSVSDKSKSHSDNSLKKIANLIRIIPSESTKAARSNIYLAGGIVATTPQILVVDILNGTLPAHLVTGALVPDAHNVHAQTSSCSLESFALRLLRRNNQACFIKAFTDDPLALVSSYLYGSRSRNAGSIGSLSNVMRALHIRSIYLYPRFHVQVQQSLSASQEPSPKQPQNTGIELIELRIPLTRRMKRVQSSILDCMHDIILDIKRSYPSAFADDNDDATAPTDSTTHNDSISNPTRIDTALYTPLDTIIQSRLAPVFHHVSSRTRNLIRNLRLLRHVLVYLLVYDCVMFYRLLETMVMANNVGNSNGPKTSGVGVMGHESEECPWIMLDAAQTVFTIARERVYCKSTDPVASSSTNPSSSSNTSSTQNTLQVSGIPQNVVPVLEEQPKYRAIAQIIREIMRDRNTHLLTTLQPNTVPSDPLNILVMASNTVTCTHLHRIITSVISSHAQPDSIGTRKRKSKDDDTPVFSSDGSRHILTSSLTRYFDWKRHAMGVAQRGVNANPTPVATNSTVSRSSRDGARDTKRSRVAASTATSSVTKPSDYNATVTQMMKVSMQLQQQGVDADETKRREMMSMVFDQDTVATDHGNDTIDLTSSASDAPAFSATDHQTTHAKPFIYIKPYTNTSTYATNTDTQSIEQVVPTQDTGSAVHTIRSDIDTMQTLLLVRPRYIIMHDPDMATIRCIEQYQSIYTRTRVTDTNDDDDDDHNDGQVKVYFCVYDNSVEEQRYLMDIRREKESFERLITQKSTMVIPITPSHIITTDHDTDALDGVSNRVVVIDVREFRSGVPSALDHVGVKLDPRLLTVADYVPTPFTGIERKAIPDLVSSIRDGRLHTQIGILVQWYKVPVLLVESDDMVVRVNGAANTGASNTPGMTSEIISQLCGLVMTYPTLRIVWTFGASSTSETILDMKHGNPEPSAEDALQKGTDTHGSRVLQHMPDLTEKALKAGSIYDMVDLAESDLGDPLYRFFNTKFR